MKKIIILLFFVVSNYVYGINYYVRPTGNNANNGTSPTTAWQNLNNVNTTTFVAGDNIYLEQGFTYSGNIYFESTDIGTAVNPVTVTSWNAAGALTGRATINSGNLAGIYAYNTAGLKITDLNFFGNTTTNDGIAFYCDLPNNTKFNYILIDKVEVKGYKNGIAIGSWNMASGYTNVTISNSESHDNIRTGITTYAQSKFANQNFTVTYCKAYNNLGDLNITTTNTGSGIVLGGVDGGNINHCIAYNNGENNRNTSGGPVGIWCYEANNIVMEYNESYNNKAGLNLDGGGFDIDGGATNCIMQYNYSHGNEGAGYLFAQFSGATAMDNNICRYNISENDGRKNGFAGIELFSAPGHSMSNTFIYNNTIFISPASTGSPAGVVILNGTTTTNTQFRNNIFVTTSGVSVIKANSTSGISFMGNNYWSSGGAFNINWGGTNYSSLSGFKTSGQETGTGFEVDPKLVSPNTGITIGNTNNLNTLLGYKLQASSPMIDVGQTLTNPGSKDFYGGPIPVNNVLDIGAHEYNPQLLPVGLINFHGKATLNGCVLKWITANEKNNSGFEILRSIDGIKFEKVGFKKSLAIGGNSSSVLDYSFNDVITEENVYYQLNQIDFDGTFSLSPIIVIKIGFVPDALVYPNPVVDHVNIILTSSLKNKVDISVYDHNAKMVISHVTTLNKGQNNIHLDMNNLGTGLYLINIKDALGLQIMSKKIIKL